jgi:hypothetical protein
MAKSLQQIQEENARMEHAGNTGAAIGTGLVLFFWVFLPIVIISLTVIVSK